MNDVCIKFGTYVKNIRLSKNISAADIEKNFGITMPQWSRIENAKQNGLPKHDLMIQIAKILDVNIIDLYLTAGYLTRDDINKASGSSKLNGFIQNPDSEIEIVHTTIFTEYDFQRGHMLQDYLLPGTAEEKLNQINELLTPVLDNDIPLVKILYRDTQPVIENREYLFLGFKFDKVEFEINLIINVLVTLVFNKQNFTKPVLPSIYKLIANTLKSPNKETFDKLKNILGFCINNVNLIKPYEYSINFDI